MARHHDDPDAAFWGWCDVWLDSAFRTWTLDEEAQAVSAPTLVIQGREDPYGTLAQVERIVSAVGPSAQTLLVPGGHSPHLDATDQVIAGVAAFCSDLA
jgi:pimeloyl-ACP methyl ester carboxylesterase